MGRRQGALLVLVLLVWWLGAVPPVWAARIDPYVQRYLQADNPVALPADASGTLRTFTAADLSVGKRLFEKNCLNCHVGGATLPNPRVSLSLTDLKGATPPRDNIAALMAFVRSPRSYDGREESYTCRALPPESVPDGALAQLAAFILRAAQVAPGWGSKDL